MRNRLLAVLLAVCLLMAGCKGSTTISREEQLEHLDTISTTAENTPETDAVTTCPTTPEETTQTGEALATEVQTTPPAPATEPEETTAPEETTSSGETTDPQQTTAATTEPELSPTQPENTEPEQETTVPETATEATTEETTEEATEPTTEETEPDTDTFEDLEYGILAVINEYRVQNGLGKLTMDNRLAEVALIRAEECAVKFSHTRPDGREWYTALDDYGYSWRHKIAENLLRGYTGMSARMMVDAWMDSDGHRKNILNGDMTVAGISVYISGGTLYVVNLFEG